jgi:hypothetical protein
MNPVQPSVSQQPAAGQEFHNISSGGNKTKKVFVWLLVLILIGAGVFGGYVYGKGKNKIADNTSANKVPTSAQTTTSAPAVHLVSSNAYPYDLGAKKIFTTKLGVPSNLQAVRTPSGNNNRGPEQYFTDKYNDELGRWLLGDPTDPGANGGGNSEVSVLAISKSWLAAKSEAADTEIATGYKLDTPADKQKFLSTIKTNTDTCAKDPKKGFTAKDGSFKVCYKLEFGREAYSPLVTLDGYAEKDTVPVYLTGFINIYDNTPMADQNAELKAVSDAKAGKYTAKFSSSWNALLNALQESTLTTADNPAVKS